MKLILPENRLLALDETTYYHPEEADEFTIGSEGGNNSYFHAINGDIKENMENEVETTDVNLESFKKQSTLAPKIWKGNKINAKVRLKLLDIADDFWDYVNVSWVKRKGVIITGSICNYNWSKFSDIDVHIVVDFKEVDERTDFVQEYFDSKKNEWNNDHENLKIYGFPVEMYIEDANSETESGGIYDLEDNSWVKTPNIDDIHSIGLNKYEIKNKSAKIMTKIDDYKNAVETIDDKAKLRSIGKKSKKLLNKIKAMRKFGLKRDGETDIYNIIYKILRRTNYLDKLWGISSTLYDKENSINESKRIKKPLTEMFDTHNMAGTDFPRYTDENGNVWSAQWCDGGNTYPFGYWPVDGYNDYEFSVGDIGSTHSNACNKIIEKYINYYCEENASKDASTIIDYINELIYDLSSMGDEEREEFNISDWVYDVIDNLYLFSFAQNYIEELGNDAVETLKAPDLEDVTDNLIDIFDDEIYDYFDFNDGQDKFKGALDLLGTSFSEFFELGTMQGRVWFDDEIMGFYSTPSSNELLEIIHDLAFYFDMSYKEFYDFKVIYEDYDDNGEVKMSSVYDFIYGDDEEDDDNEFAKTEKSASGIEFQQHVLSPMLKQKRDVYDGWGSKFKPKDMHQGELMAQYHSRKYQESKKPQKLRLSMRQLNLLSEEVVADGNPDHNPYAKLWKMEKDKLKSYIMNNGHMMTSMENGKVYMVLYDTTLSGYLGTNYCYCVQIDTEKMKPTGTVYIRALNTFTERMFQANFDTRGHDNMEGTADDIR